MFKQRWVLVQSCSLEGILLKYWEKVVFLTCSREVVPSVVRGKFTFYWFNKKKLLVLLVSENKSYFLKKAVFRSSRKSWWCFLKLFKWSCAIGSDFFFFSVLTREGSKGGDDELVMERHLAFRMKRQGMQTLIYSCMDTQAQPGEGMRAITDLSVRHRLQLPWDYRWLRYSIRRYECEERYVEALVWLWGEEKKKGPSLATVLEKLCQCFLTFSGPSCLALHESGFDCSGPLAVWW